MLKLKKKNIDGKYRLYIECSVQNIKIYNSNMQIFPTLYIPMYYEKNFPTVMIINSTNINKAINHLSP